MGRVGPGGLVDHVIFPFYSKAVLVHGASRRLLAIGDFHSNAVLVWGGLLVMGVSTQRQGWSGGALWR